MLLRLLRTHLRRYRGPLWVVIALQLVATMAVLYLPSLNADIIDQGIARGDTGYILDTGGWMLLITLVQIACSVGAVSPAHHSTWEPSGSSRDTAWAPGIPSASVSGGTDIS